ncbi:MAG: hypothetical protein ACLFQB_11970 [Chitinispirillaceae bacterium]
MRTGIVLLCLVVTAAANPLKLFRWRGDSLPDTITASRYMSAGVAWVDVEDLNGRIDDFGLGEFSSYSLNLALGWSVTRDRLISGGEWEGLFWRGNEIGGQRSSFWASRLFFNTGVDLLGCEDLSFYPLVGIGAGLSALRAGPAQVSFTEALVEPQQTMSIYQLSFLINAGAGFDYKLSSWRGYRNMLIGFRAGYVFDPAGSTQWSRGISEVTDGPEPLLRGAYVRIVLGNSVRFSPKRIRRMRKRSEGR